MTGTVYLVGAGPGDPGLITLRAVELIKKADVVLYDRLVSKKIISMIPKKAKSVYVGRTVGDDYKHQDDTNELMVEYAKTKRHVVRLKGGDPIIFGRGGEEAEYLKKHKIKFEIIPGVTSVFVTGHEDFEKKKEDVRWKKLAKSTDTIVVMMGLGRINIICKQLSAGGMEKNMPVAVIQDGTTTKQKMVVGTISNIVQKVKQSKIKPPSIIIIGKVVSLSKTIGWRKK